MTTEYIGRCMGVHANQVAQYIRNYQYQGLTNLTSTAYGTNQSNLGDHAESLVNNFTAYPFLKSS